MVLDVETRIDRQALAASGRRSHPRDMPAPLQVLTAVAMLFFERDALGDLSGFRLVSHEAPPSGEAALASASERELCRLFSAGGELVTYNGRHDLTVLRYALMRSRAFGGAGAIRWLRDDAGRHRDLMREVARDTRWPSLADVAAGLGFAAGQLLTGGAKPGTGLEKAEADVAMTLLLHIHLEAEASGDPVALSRGTLRFGRFLASDAARRPHFAALLSSPLYAGASRGLSKGLD